MGKSIIHYFDWAMASIAIFVCLPEGKAETWISPWKQYLVRGLEHLENFSEID